jgi:uncharacterized protein YecE (DUF72 family)
MVKKSMTFPTNLLVGTSSWSSSDWLGSFYPPNLKPGQFIEAYSRKLPAVEIDSTYYSIPSPQVVSSWREKTPPGFIFAAKIPGAITHEKVLMDCQLEMTTFLNNMSLLGDRLGPLAPAISQDVAQRIQIRLGDTQQELDQLGFS